MSRRVRRAVIGIALAVAMAVAGIGLWRGLKPPGTVDGVRVTRTAMDFYRGQVARSAEQSGDSDAQRDARAVSALRHDYGLLAIRAEQGLTDARRVDDVLSQREASNEEREHMAAEGKVVYGRVSADPQEYVHKYLSQLQTALVAKMSQGRSPVLKVSDADVIAALDADPQRWRQAASTYWLTATQVPAQTLGGTTSQETARTLAQMPRAKLRSLPGARTTSTSYSAQQWQQMPFGPEAERDIADARPGQTIGAYPRQQGWVVLVIDRVTVDRAQALAAYRNPLRQSLLDQQLQALIGKRVQRQDVQLS